MSHKLIRMLAWLFLGAIFLFTDGPIWMRPILGYHPNAERFSGLFVVALLFGLAYPRRLRLILPGLAIAIVILEYLQTYIPHRHGSIHDALIKSAGAALGVGAAYLIHLFSTFSKIRNDRN
jgi:hypothetical protein